MSVFLLTVVGLVANWNSRLVVVVYGAETLAWAEVVCKVGTGSQTCAYLLLITVLLLASVLPLLLGVIVVLSFLAVLLWGRSDHSVSLVYYTTVIGGILGCSCSERSKLLLLIWIWTTLMGHFLLSGTFFECVVVCALLSCVFKSNIALNSWVLAVIRRLIWNLVWISGLRRVTRWA